MFSHLVLLFLPDNQVGKQSTDPGPSWSFDPRNVKCIMVGQLTPPIPCSQCLASSPDDKWRGELIVIKLQLEGWNEKGGDLIWWKIIILNAALTLPPPKKKKKSETPRWLNLIFFSNFFGQCSWLLNLPCYSLTGVVHFQKSWVICLTEVKFHEYHCYYRYRSS